MRAWSIAVAATVVACGGTQVIGEGVPLPQPTAESRAMAASEVVWEKLNPARGDKSPQAGTLWGDRKGKVATGFLVKFVDGFSSPPHIHNVSYRGVVIAGLVHNDDPAAAAMWMPPGAFWTQPKGENHITSAKGATNIAYIEIESGPYLVRPAADAFDSGERPVNVDPSNVVWLDTPRAAGSKTAYLWGSPNGGALYGTFVKLPGGFTGGIRSGGATFRAVVISGEVTHVASGKRLAPGSLISADGPSKHAVSTPAGTEAVVYIRTDGRYEVSRR